MEAGVAAIIADVVIKMAMDIGKKRDRLAIIIMIAAFIATYFVNIMVIIIVCGIIGIIASRFNKK